MELIKYDEATRTSTITLTNDELVRIHSVLSGVLNTFPSQDPNIIGMKEEPLRIVKNGVTRILEQVNALMMHR